jgi:hypothetical protein
VLIALAVYALTWWILTKPSRTPTIGTMSFALTVLPATIATVGVLQWRTFKLRYELSLPVERKSYLRQLVTAAALSHVGLWGGMSVALVLWWLLNAPQPLPIAKLFDVLAFSAAFQIVFFGVAVWIARYRSMALVGVVVAVLVGAGQAWHMEGSMSSHGLLPHMALWIAGVTAVLGLLITGDAYRRWLAADID